MALIYTDYFQKSKVFLYPLLGIGRKATYVPKQTYICWDNVYSTEDCKLILEYKTKPTVAFKKFASRYLDKHVMYEDYLELSDNKVIYIIEHAGLVKLTQQINNGESFMIAWNKK